MCMAVRITDAFQNEIPLLTETQEHMTTLLKTV